MILLPAEEARDVRAPESPFMRAYLTEKAGVREHELQTALASTLQASPCAWPELANANHMPSFATAKTGTPGWACEGTRFWAATQPETHTTITVYIGLVSRDKTSPPDVADLACRGPREVLEVLRKYKGSPAAVVEMYDDTRATAMELDIPSGVLDQLAKATNIQVGVSALVPTAGAAIAHYLKSAKLGETIAVAVVGLVIAALAWLASAWAAARKERPSWRRNGWEAAE